MTDAPLVLGIETSCDETGVGIVHGTELLVDAVASSVCSSNCALRSAYSRTATSTPYVISRLNHASCWPCSKYATGASTGVGHRSVASRAVPMSGKCAAFVGASR